MSTSASQGHPPNALYAQAITQAVASGDAAKMSAARDAAFAHIATSADVKRLLPELEKAMKAKGVPIRPLYAVTIQDAIAKGDAAELNRLKGEVALYASMLNSGAAANHPIPPYGVAIQEAKNRGDEAEVQRLTAQAKSLLDQLNWTS